MTRQLDWPASTATGFFSEQEVFSTAAKTGKRWRSGEGLLAGAQSDEAFGAGDCCNNNYNG